jgi:hypothetical protein
MSAPAPTQRRKAQILAFVGLLVTALLAVRLLTAISTGTSLALAIRTYVYWALMLAPVAILADMLVRHAAENYRPARVRNRIERNDHSRR